MATVQHHRDDDAASISSVPESHYQGDSDSDDEDMIQSLAAPPTAPLLSPKEREAQAEREAALRTMSTGQSSARRQSHPHSRHTALDDIPPPPYSEAPMPPVPPANAPPANAAPPVVDAVENNQSQVNERSPVLSTAPLTNYGSIGQQTHGNADESGYSQDTHQGHYSDAPDAEETPPRNGVRFYRENKQLKISCIFGRKRKRNPNDDPRWRDPKTDAQRRRRRIRWFIVFVIFLAPLCYLFDQFVEQLAEDAKKNRSSHPPNSTATSTPSLPQPTSGVTPSPIFPTPDPDDSVVHRESYCPGAVWSNFYIENVPRRNMAIYESWKRQSIIGAVRVVPAPWSQAEPIKAAVAFAVLPQYQLSRAGFTNNDGSVNIETPVFERKDSGAVVSEVGCADADVIISIRPDAVLDNLLVHTDHMSIYVYPGLFANSTNSGGLHVQDTVTLRTISNQITVSGLSAPYIEVSSTSGTVRGTFALYKTVHISTVSSTIDVDIEPKPAPADDPTHPAELDIRSTSGTIKAHMPVTGQIPNRIYKTIIRSTSSSSKGELIFGDASEISSQSGTLTFDLLPYVFALERKLSSIAAPVVQELPDSSDFSSAPEALKVSEAPRAPAAPGGAQLLPSLPGFEVDRFDMSKVGCRDYRFFPIKLDTHTVSSSTHLKILEPYNPIRSECDFPVMETTHSSSSGSVDLVYPDGWTGVMHAQSISGSIKIWGGNIVRLRSFWEWLMGFGETGSWMRLDENGDAGDSLVTIKTISSSIKLEFV